MPHQGERKLMQHYTFHTKVYCLFCLRKAVGTVFRRTFAVKKINPRITETMKKDTIPSQLNLRCAMQKKM